ncbi:MAG: ketopantoate reductase family protein [Treponema sp.]|jgi:2-dehydropantoate 2-reductase|nr:ketopantoate reductase family protein [Treponema sp.]
MIHSVLIAGAGAIGLTVAETFYNYEKTCVSVLGKGERLRRYREKGLWVNGRRLDFVLLDAEAGPGEGPFPDLVIVACKNHHLAEITGDLEPFIGKNTIIVSLLNGIKSEEEIGAVFGRERLPLAMILGADSQRNDDGVRFTCRGVVHFGDAGGRETERDKSIAEFFTRAALPFEYHPADMKRTLWFKFMVNVGANQTSALLRLPYRAFKKKSPFVIKEAGEILESAMREVVAIAAAEGISLGEKDIEKWLDNVGLLSDDGYTSMAQDVLAGRKTEAELFGLTVMEYGKKHGIPTPVNETLYRALRAIEQSYT